MMPADTDTLKPEEIRRYLRTKWLGRELYYEETVDSTNTRARILAGKGAAHGAVVLAEEQVSGKGRRGRGWVTPRGSSVAMTCILRPDFMPQKASMLTLLMGLSVAQACRGLYHLDAGIKWPNDIVISGKKLCGILTEMDGGAEQIRSVVIGVGVNGNLTEFPEELKNKATSLQQELGERIVRASLAAAVLGAFEKNYEIFCRHTDLSAFREGYDQMLVHKDRTVTVHGAGKDKGELCGVALGINAQGELLVEREDRTVVKVNAGEVSVRGLDGYV